ncbi:PREDICTED: lupus La protein-like, partial [Amphimedon queenslandica]
VSEDGLKVKRKSSDPVPTLSLLSPEDRKDMSNRTLYMKGFPKDSTLDDIQDFLLPFGETEMIRMKKDLDKQFKGSIFVEYKLVDSISKVLEKKAELKYKDELLTVETKQDYFKRKDAERKEKKAQSRVESSSGSATETS